MLLGLDTETGYVQPFSFRFYEKEKLNEQCQWLAQNAELFTLEQRIEIFAEIVTFIRVTVNGMVKFRGAKFEDVMSLVDNAMRVAVEGFRTRDGEQFAKIQIDPAAIESTGVEGFNPTTWSFRVTELGMKHSTQV